MLVAAACCPCPPALVPAVAAGAAGELDALRARCDAAVVALLSAHADAIVVVGRGSRTREHATNAVGSMHPHGVDVALGSLGGPVALPSSLGVGRWLLERALAPLRATRCWEVDGAASGAACAELGPRLVDGDVRVAMLVMGGGAAQPAIRPADDQDERSRGYDAAAVAALRAADVAALRALDGAAAADLLVDGWPAWQVLAGALAASAGQWSSDVHYESPYRVGYLVASLRRDG